jgi:hypothetical protein
MIRCCHTAQQNFGYYHVRISGRSCNVPVFKRGSSGIGVKLDMVCLPRGLGILGHVASAFHAVTNNVNESCFSIAILLPKTQSEWRSVKVEGAV